LWTKWKPQATAFQAVVTGRGEGGGVEGYRENM
jgi:hypothetical protein